MSWVGASWDPPVSEGEVELVLDLDGATAETLRAQPAGWHEMLRPGGIAIIAAPAEERSSELVGRFLKDAFRRLVLLEGLFVRGPAFEVDTSTPIGRGGHPGAEAAGIPYFLCVR